MQMKNLTGKTVVITGASSGFGEALAYAVARRGGSLLLGARRMEELIRVKNTAESFGAGSVRVQALDVTNADMVAEFAQLANDLAADVLINNAGFGRFENFLDFDLALARQMFEVNVLGLMTMTQQVALGMAERGRGHIINIASIAGKIASPKSAVYSATKFAVVGFSNALRLELKPLGVQVTTVNPGPIKTPFWLVAKSGQEYLDKLGPLTINADQLAETIVDVIGTRRREVNRPQIMETAAIFYTLFPRLADALAGSIFNLK
jgi:short-subunit dehydrogenase